MLDHWESDRKRWIRSYIFKGLVWVLVLVGLLVTGSGLCQQSGRDVYAAALPVKGSAIASKAGLAGSGTSSDPWQIGSEADLETVRQEVAEGHSYAGEYLR